MSSPLALLGSGNLAEEISSRLLRPLLIGTFLGCLICGILLCLVYRYFVLYPRDRLGFKLLVVGVAALAILDTVVFCTWAEKWTAGAFGQPLKLMDVPVVIPLYCMVSSSCIVVTYIYHSWRLWTVSKWRGLPFVGLIALSAVACAVLGAYLTYRCATAKTILAVLDLEDLLIASFSIASGADIVVTVAATYFLIWRRRRETKSSSFLTNFALVMIRTNLLCSILQLVLLIITVSRTFGLWYISLGGFLSKILIVRPPPSFAPPTTVLRPNAPVRNFFSILLPWPLTCRRRGRGATAKQPNVCVTVEHAVEVERDITPSDFSPLPFRTDKLAASHSPTTGPARPLASFRPTSTIRSTASSAWERSRIAPFATEPEIDEAVEAELLAERARRMNQDMPTNVPFDWWLQPAYIEATASIILGPLLIGTYLTCILAGVVLCLVHRYFTLFPKDRLAFKLLVLAVLVLSILDTAVFCCWSSVWGVQSYGDPRKILKMPLVVSLYCLLTAITYGLSYFYHAWRLHIISKRKGWPLSSFVFLCALASLAMGGYLSATTFKAFWLSELLNQWKILVAFFVITVAADLAITGGAIYWLLWKRRREGACRKQHSSVINAIAHNTITTNMICALLQVALLSLLLTTEGLQYTVIGTIINKTYLASIVGTLLVRPSSSSSASDAPSLSMPKPNRFAVLAPFFSRDRRRPKRRGGGGRGFTTTEVAVTVEKSIVEVLGRDDDVPVSCANSDNDHVPALSFSIPLTARPARPATAFSPTQSIRSAATSSSAWERSRIAPFATDWEVGEAVEAEMERDRTAALGESWEEAEKRMGRLV
ncbi:hypothetical protein JCM8097_006279 [Rhodosporidiobolus ruineniae]